MIRRESTIQNAEGFHIRPAQLFMEKANEFRSDVMVLTEDGMEADGKSILGLMTLGLETGAKIILEIDGEDEAAAADALVELINNKFGEQ